MGRPILPSPITATCTSPTTFLLSTGTPAWLAPGIAAGAERELHRHRALVDPPAEDLEGPQAGQHEGVGGRDGGRVSGAVRPEHGHPRARRNAGAAGQRAGEEYHSRSEERRVG